jgi:1-acyl-sn-glycerol-3-phosphate acyltransferase
MMRDTRNGPQIAPGSNDLLRATDLPTWRQRAALRVLHLFGWRIRFKPLPGPHGIAVVYPHTSNLDFFIGLVTKWALGVPFRWLAKESVFRGPPGVLMRYWGGLPVERRGAPSGATQRLADQITNADWMWIAITPEGARAHRPHWKSGFYHLAVAAHVPLVLIALDYGKKEVRFTETLRLTGDQAADMAAIAARYQDVTARYPQQAAPIVLAPPRPADAPERRRS